MAESLITLVHSPGLSYAFTEAIGMSPALLSWLGPSGHHSFDSFIQLPLYIAWETRGRGLSSHCGEDSPGFLINAFRTDTSFMKFTFLAEAKYFRELKGTHIRDLLVTSGGGWRAEDVGWVLWLRFPQPTALCQQVCAYRCNQCENSYF